MKTKTLVRLIGLVGLLTSLTQAAPLGTGFTYQGRLSDGGQPASGAYDLRFTLHDAATDGVVVAGPITNGPVGVANGLFTVTLDFGPGVFTGDARWLEISVRTNGNGAFAMLSPRQLLRPMPYALFTQSAAAVTGPVAASQLTGTIAPGNIGDAIISSAMLAPGSVGNAALAEGAVTSNKLGATVGVWIRSGPDRLYTLDEVGIGTATPESELHVAGEVRAVRFSGSGAGLSGITGSALVDGSVTTAKIAPGAVGSMHLAKPPQAGSITSRGLGFDFTQTDFSVSFSPPFNTMPVVTCSLEAAGHLGAESKLYLTGKSANGFSGQWHGPLPAPVTVDSGGSVGAHSSLAVVNGQPAISYRDTSNGDLKYVRAKDDSGTSWTPPVTVDSGGDVGQYTSLVVVNGRPAISYYHVGNGDLKYVRANDTDGTSWAAPVTVDSAGTVGYHTSLAVVNGNPAISYLNASSYDLRYVRANDASGTSWATPVTVDSTWEVGYYTSLAVVDGNPAISYWYATSNDLKYVRANDASGASWAAPVTVDSTGDVGSHTSLAAVNGHPAISYYDVGNRDLKYVRANDASGTNWATPVTLDSAVDVGEYTSLAAVNGHPAISYYDRSNADLKYVRANDASGTDWATPVTLDSSGAVGQYTSLAVVNGNAAVTYYDSSNGDLKFICGGGRVFTINWIALEP